MNKQYFVVDFAHSLHGRVKRVHFGYRSLACTAACVLALALLSFGLFSRYVQMSWRTSNYDHLRADFDNLRKRYTELQRQANQHKQQMASLETLASEVSVAYGISEQGSPAASGALDSDGAPNLRQSIERFNYLESASFSGIERHYVYRWQAHNAPSLWPVMGTILALSALVWIRFPGMKERFTQESTCRRLPVRRCKPLETVWWRALAGAVATANSL